MKTVDDGKHTGLHWYTVTIAYQFTNTNKLFKTNLRIFINNSAGSPSTGIVAKLLDRVIVTSEFEL